MYTQFFYNVPKVKVKSIIIACLKLERVHHSLYGLAYLSTIINKTNFCSHEEIVCMFCYALLISKKMQLEL